MNERYWEALGSYWNQSAHLHLQILHLLVWVHHTCCTLVAVQSSCCHKSWGQKSDRHVTPKNQLLTGPTRLYIHSIKCKAINAHTPVGAGPVSSLNVKIGSSATTTSETTSTAPSSTTSAATSSLCELSSTGGEWYFDWFTVEFFAWNETKSSAGCPMIQVFLFAWRICFVLTIKPINSSFGRGRVIKWHCSFSLWPAGGLVRVDVDHWLASLLVYLQPQNDHMRLNTTNQNKMSMTCFTCQHKRLIHLDDTNLLEEVADFLNGGLFSQPLDKNGVVVRVVLLTSCGEDS